MNRKQINLATRKNKAFKALVSVLCLSLTFPLFGGIVFRIDNSHAIAEQESSVGLSTKASISIRPLPSNIYTLNVDSPTQAGQFVQTVDIPVTVDTNNETGYVLTMASKDTTNLTLGGFRSDSIPTLDSSIPLASFPADRWGYSLDSGSNFLPMDTSPITLLSFDSFTTAQTKNVRFGAKISTAKTAGTYQGIITFTATMNPGTGPTTMQEMTAEVCNAMSPNDTMQLIDTRDGNEYTIVKLGDPINKCWMQENLRLGKSGTSYTLDSTNSDLPSSTTFTLGPAQTSGTDDWSCTDDDACKTSRVYATNNTEYGNYYSWYTATANTDTTNSAGVLYIATGSICPKGWRLPSVSTTDDSPYSSEFETLNDTYNSGSTSSDAGLLASPLNLVRAGYYNNGVNNQGSYGKYWLNFRELNVLAFKIFGMSLYFSSSGADAFMFSESSDGYSVRCISQDSLSTYTLNYNANGGSNAPATQSVSIDYAPTITLSSDTPTPPSGSGKTFAGWATSSTATTAEYQPGDSYTFTSSEPVTLYAVWEEPHLPTPTTLQEMTPEYCASMSANDTLTLKDSRDQNEYTIVKLGDPINKCWMQENLRLGKSGTTYTLDSTNSNLPSGTTFTLDSAQTSGTDDWSCTDDDACKTSRVYATGNTDYGNYYSWYTATANTGTYSMSTDGQNASGSICPKGWRLPTGDDSGEFTTLNNTYNSGSTSSDAGLRASPLNLVRAGGYVDGPYAQGSYGYYWSSTVNSETSAYSLFFFLSFNVSPASYPNKSNGLSVRCITDSATQSNANSAPARLSAPRSSTSPSTTTSTSESGESETSETTPSTEDSERDPLGQTHSISDNTSAAVIAALVGVLVSVASFFILFLIKRKKDDEEELNVDK